MHFRIEFRPRNHPAIVSDYASLPICKLRVQGAEGAVFVCVYIYIYGYTLYKIVNPMPGLGQQDSILESRLNVKVEERKERRERERRSGLQAHSQLRDKK